MEVLKVMEGNLLTLLLPATVILTLNILPEGYNHIVLGTFDFMRKRQLTYRYRNAFFTILFMSMADIFLYEVICRCCNWSSITPLKATAVFFLLAFAILSKEYLVAENSYIRVLIWSGCIILLPVLAVTSIIIFHVQWDKYVLFLIPFWIASDIAILWLGVRAGMKGDY